MKFTLTIALLNTVIHLNHELNRADRYGQENSVSRASRQINGHNKPEFNQFCVDFHVKTCCEMFLNRKDLPCCPISVLWFVSIQKKNTLFNSLHQQPKSIMGLLSQRSNGGHTQILQFSISFTKISRENIINNLQYAKHVKQKRYIQRNL